MTLSKIKIKNLIFRNLFFIKASFWKTNKVFSEFYHNINLIFFKIKNIFKKHLKTGTKIVTSTLNVLIFIKIEGIN
jgi:hypothetical protein